MAETFIKNSVTGDVYKRQAYNHNVLKLAQEYLDDQENEIELFVVGELGRQYFMGQHIPIQENFQYTAQNPTFSRARWIAEILLGKFLSGELDEIDVIFTRMETVSYTHLIKICAENDRKTDGEDTLNQFHNNVLGAFVIMKLIECIPVSYTHLAGISQRIPLDEMIQVMYTVGKRIPAELRETAMGGCATAPSVCGGCNGCG